MLGDLETTVGLGEHMGTAPPVAAAAGVSGTATGGLPDATAGGIDPSRVRRVLDVAVGTLALLLFAVPMVLIALVIRLDSPGPALFRQTRVGQGGRPFTIYKFRTMRAGARGPMLTSPGDDRVTRVGRVLRGAHLDELPQLFNLLRGSMTLVGSRPQTMNLAVRYGEAEAPVFQYRPGLTGPGVLGLNDDDVLPPAHLGDETIEAYYLSHVVPGRVALDLAYLRDPSLRATIRLLVRTCGRVARRAVPARSRAEPQTTSP